MTVVHLGLGLLLTGPAGFPVQAAIPIAYSVGVCCHFCLQRWFVFAHKAFALSARQQLARYLPMTLTQYALTAILTAVLPGLTGSSDQIAYVIAVITVAAAGFVFLRLHVFTAHEQP